MKLDPFETIVMEQTVWPGSIGDSMAETSRLFILNEFLRTHGSVKLYAHKLDLMQFRTVSGYVRHPTAPHAALGTGHNWREPDASSDQCLPWLMAVMLQNPITASYFVDDFRFRIKGTKTIASLPLQFLARGKFKALALSNQVQELIFKIPYRWSDDERMKGKLLKFERSESSSADFLNYFAIYAFFKTRGEHCKMGLKHELVLNKIKSYYSPEPNSQWLINLYEEAFMLIKLRY